MGMGRGVGGLQMPCYLETTLCWFRALMVGQASPDSSRSHPATDTISTNWVHREATFFDLLTFYFV